MIFSQDGLFLYVLCELNDLLSVFSYKDGEISHIQNIKAYNGEGKYIFLKKENFFILVID